MKYFFLSAALLFAGFGCAPATTISLPATTDQQSAATAASVVLTDGRYAVDDHTFIDIKQLNTSTFYFHAEAYWVGANPDNIHVGDIEGEVSLVDNYGVWAEPDSSECIVAFDVISPTTLHLEENGHCGGVNVTFNGYYYKK